MTDFPASYPPDEPVIGAGTPPPPPRPRAPIQPSDGWIGGDATPAPNPVPEYEADDYQEYDAGEEPFDEGDPYGRYPRYGYDDGYDDRPPVRQPMFYVFLGLATLVGAAAIFLLVTVFRDNGNNNASGSTPASAASASADFRVSLVSPKAGDRISTGTPQAVDVNATSTDQIVRFELYSNNQMVDQVAAGNPDGKQVYSATLHTTFDKRGDYPLYVRVVSASGASSKSSVVKVTAVEDVGARPQEIRGRLIAATTTRSGPGDNFADLGTVNPPLEVVVTGKSDDGNWLLVNIDGGKWLKTLAVDVPDLALVPVQQPSSPPTPLPVITTTTAAPTPTATGTSAPSPTATAAPAPDFVPTNAVVNGSKLRVSVTNIAPTAYSGQLVVAVSGDILTDARAFAVTIPGNTGHVDLDFDLAQPVTQQGKRVIVTVNPDKNPRELNYDNNSATFVIAVAAEPPVIALSAVAQPNQVTVTITDSGGPLASPGAHVTIDLQTTDGSSRTEKVVDLALTRTTPQTVIVPRPQGFGTAQVALVVAGQSIATTTVQFTQP